MKGLGHKNFLYIRKCGVYLLGEKIIPYLFDLHITDSFHFLSLKSTYSYRVSLTIMNTPYMHLFAYVSGLLLY